MATPTKRSLKLLEERATAIAMDELNARIEKQIGPIQRALASGDQAVIEKILTGGTLGKADVATLPARVNKHVQDMLKAIEPAMASAISPVVEIAVKREFQPLRDQLEALQKRVAEVARG